MAQDVDSGHRGRPAVGVGEGREDADGGRLARAVRAEHAEDRALAHVEVEPAQGVCLAEGLVEADGLDHRVCHLGCSSRSVDQPSGSVLGRQMRGHHPPSPDDPRHQWPAQRAHPCRRAQAPELIGPDGRGVGSVRGTSSHRRRLHGRDDLDALIRGGGNVPTLRGDDLLATVPGLASWQTSSRSTGASCPRRT